MKKVTILFIGLGLLLVFSQDMAARGRGGGSIPGHISLSATGAVDAYQDCDTSLGADDTSYLCNKAGIDHTILLGDFFLHDEGLPLPGWRIYPTGASAEKCFGAGLFDVTFGVMLNKDKSAGAVVRFWAYKKDGATKILYVLWLNDPNGWLGDFPPQPDESAVMGEPGAVGVRYDLTTSKRNEAVDACVDSGIFTNPADFIEVTFTRDS